MSRLGKLYFISGFILIIGIVVSDILSPHFIVPGKLGTILWIISYFFVAIFALRCLKNLLLWGIKKVSVISLLLMLLFVFIIAMQVGNPASLSGETTIETECALNYLQNADDLGFRKTCLFGYPARQYFLSSLPTIIFSRSLVNLNLGGALYFLMGIVIFTYGLFRYFGINKKTDIIATLALSSLLHFYYFNHFLFKFEQSIFPLSFGLILVGAMMEYSRKFYKPALIPIALSVFYLTSSYTPSLALFGLSICILVYFLFKAKDNLSKAALLFIIISSATVFTGTLLFRNDINFSESSRPFVQMKDDIKYSFQHLATGNLPDPFTSIFFRYILILILLISLIGFAGYGGIFFSMWILAVIIFAIISKGYIYYALEFRLHRVLVALPVLLFLLSKLASRMSKFKIPFLSSSWSFRALIVFVFIITTTGLYYNQNFLKKRSPNPHYEYIEWIKDNVDTESQSILYVTHEAGRFNDLISLSDTIRYFIPKINALYVSSTEVLKEDCTPEKGISGSILIPEVHQCYFPLITLSATSTNVSTVGGFKSSPQMNLVLFEVK